LPPCSGELRIGTDAADLALVYPWLDAAVEALKVPESMLCGMHIALEEAVMNVAMHAYPSDGQNNMCAKDIALWLDVTPAAAVLIVEDNGRAFDVASASAGARPPNLSELKAGGLGFVLLRHYCPEIGYERVGGRNRLTLRFPLPVGSTTETSPS
jgi:anti-sigma regulatory factor (Ser/Thr protein kinase)